MSKRIRYWAVAAAWVLLIYSTLYIVRPICEFLRKNTPFNAVIWGSFALILAMITYYIAFRVRWKKVSSYLLFFGIAVCYVAILFWLKMPEERIHLIQYGVLACLAVRALRLDMPPLVSYGIAFVLTSILGLVDEMIQHILPNRYFDWKDVRLNAISAGLGLFLRMSIKKEGSSPN